MSDEDKKDRTVIATRKVEVKSGNEREPFLIQISGRETGKSFPLTADEIQIGRDDTCTVAVDDLHVSRHHAEIIKDDQGQLILQDLQSTNGVFVNGEKIESHALKDGDKIRIGTRLFFRFSIQDTVDQNYQQNLFRAANIDNLTGLYNKKYFVDALNKEFSFAKRNASALCLMMLDIDHFKQINDTYGHPAGDAVLRHLGKMLQTSIRLENIACRYGGEEFAIILRNVQANTAHQIAERLRANVQKEEVLHQQTPIHITISIGIASVDEADTETIDDLIEHADQCLYEAKQAGRNRTVLRKVA